MHKTKRTNKYSRKIKRRNRKTMKNVICKKGMTDEAYKYYKYAQFFKNSNKKVIKAKDTNDL